MHAGRFGGVTEPDGDAEAVATGEAEEFGELEVAGELAAVPPLLQAARASKTRGSAKSLPLLIATSEPMDPLVAD
jgi:hypothetical protein